MPKSTFPNKINYTWDYLDNLNNTCTKWYVHIYDTKLVIKLRIPALIEWKNIS